YGFTYRGWGQFLYNGGLHYKYNEDGIPITDPLLDSPKDFSGAIDMQALSAEDEHNTNTNNEIDEYTEELDENTEEKPIRVVLYSQKENNKYYNSSIVNSTSTATPAVITNAGYGLESDNSLTVTLGRFGEGNLYDVYVDPELLTSGGSSVFIGMKQYSRAKGTAKTGSLATVSGTLSE